MPRFDAHTHLFPRGFAAERAAICARDATFAEMYASEKARLASLPDLTRALGAAEMDGALVAGFAFANEREIQAQNEYLLAARSEAQHELVPFVTVNPVLAGWERWLERAATQGARGVGELRPGNQGWDPLGDEGRRLCQVAGELGLMLLWHVSEPVGHEYPGKRGGIGPVDLINLALEFPGVTMIGAHLGAGASFYFQMPELSDGLHRLYFDTAACFLLYDDKSVRGLADVVGTGRVLFGSDFPLLSPRRQAERVAAHLPPHLIPPILGDNARRILFGV